jgi:hypothetical protein
MRVRLPEQTSQRKQQSAGHGDTTLWKLSRSKARTMNRGSAIHEKPQKLTLRFVRPPLAVGPWPTQAGERTGLSFSQKNLKKVLTLRREI